MGARMQHRMKRRIGPYAFALLIAIVLSLVPPAIFADLIIPFESWENWSWKGQPHPRPRITDKNLPLALRVEVATFKTLTVPPSWVRERVTGDPTVYAAHFAERGIIYETGGVPPFAYAVSHLAWAVPFWFILTALVFELTRLVRSRRTRTREVT